MNNHEKDEFLNILCKLHKIAEVSACSEELLNSIALTWHSAKIEFEKPYKLPVQIVSTDEQYQKFFRENTSPIPINLYIQPKE
jgi:hypothetical protein